MSVPGPAPLIATALFLVGVGAAVGAFFLTGARGPRMVVRTGLVVLAGGCLVVATVLPFVIRPGPSFVRPSTRARLEILEPRPGAVLPGDPAQVDIRLRLVGGKVVPLTSSRLVPDEGHIHLYLDGALVSMTGLETRITAPPGVHTLEAEFVAVDHAPFQPRVRASVTFRTGP